MDILNLVDQNITYFTNASYPSIAEIPNSSDTWGWVSYIIGWIYTFAWSLSFYGQLYENFKNKSVKGVSFDFIILNFIGFTGYSIYNVWNYIDPKMGGGCELNDVVFALHALTITIITLFQVYFYHDKTDPQQTIAIWARTVAICFFWGLFIMLLVEDMLNLYDPRVSNSKIFRFNTIFYLGWCKALISFMKYIPQVIMNYRRKSTKGWSIFNIFLDFTGGSFSFIQNIIDSFFRNKSIISDDNLSLNLVKYAVSCISMVFDIIFVIQHYILYKGKDADENNIINDDLNKEHESELNSKFINTKSYI
jgi:cystinosin